MADYQAQIRLGVQGLDQLGRLEKRLESAVNLIGRLEQAQANVGQIAGAGDRNIRRAEYRRRQALLDEWRARRTAANVAMRRDPAGRFLPGGPNATARRLAASNLRLAQRETRESGRALRDALRDRQEIRTAERRYARALNRAGELLTEGGAVKGREALVKVQQARVDQTMRTIGEGSRGNYLTNLFQGRQRAFALGGGGRGLSGELQQQARNVAQAWELATAGGRENLQLMGKLATEMAGLLRQQNELNRGGSERSIGFEAGRRGQERIDRLSRMGGANSAKIRSLRSMATDVIAAGNLGDIPGRREAQRRMNAAIGRYERELNAAARELSARARAGGPRESIRGRKDLVGSPAYYEARARAGGPRESVRGRKDLPGSPAYYEEQQRQLAKAVRAGGPRESIKGGKDVAGSPAYYEARARAGGPRESIRGRKDLPGSPAYVEEQRKQQERIDRAVQAERSRLDRLRQYSSPIRGTADMVGSPAYYEELDRQQRKGIAGADKGERFRTTVSRQKAAVARREDEIERLSKAGISTARLQGQLDKAKAQAADGSVKAQERFKRSIIELDTNLRRLAQGAKKGLAGAGLFQGSRRQAIGEGLIGGAFPLLFGQGLGASAGGFAGGFTGGLVGGSFGFGLSLVGTAVGGAIDTTAQNLKELGAALKSPNDTLKALEKSGFRVSDSLKFQVEQLQSVGRAYDAQTLVLQEVQKRLGPGSLTELSELDKAQKQLGDQWAAIGAEIQVRLIPVLQGFVRFLGDAAEDIGGFASQSRLQRLDPGAFERLRTQAIKETSGPFGSFGNKEAYDTRLNELTRQELSSRFSGERSRIKLSPEDAFKDQAARIDASRQAADAIKSAYREAFNLQRQAYDLQRDAADINKEIADYGYRKQREIFDLRQQVVEKEIENNRGAAQNRIERGDLSARQTFAAAVGFEQQLLSNVRETVRARREGEADVEQSRRRLELAMARLNRDVEDYKRTNAREIEDIERRKLSYIRSVEDYKMRVADYVEERSRKAADYMRDAMTLPSVPGGGGGGGAPTGAALTGGSNGSKVANALISRLGLTPEQAAGVVGNLMRESGQSLNPRINEGGAVGLPARRGGYGIAQWTGSRQDDLIHFAGSAARAGDLGTQIDFLIHELKTSESRALRTLRGAGSPEQASFVFDRDFERSGIKALGERSQNARRFYNSFAPSTQTRASAQLSGIPVPTFRNVPTGATPSAAPANAQRLAVYAGLKGGEREAQRILEGQIGLRQRGIELGQIEQIMQSNQLPQLQEQHEALRLQLEARRQILGLSEQGASLIEAEAEGNARIAQIEKDRASALAGVQKQYGNDAVLARQVNAQADLALEIARREGVQRLENIELNNQLQGQTRANAEILQMQEVLAAAKVELAAAERGELEASNVELMRASASYREAEESQRRRMDGLKIETEEIRKQTRFRQQMAELQRDTGIVGAGLRAGLIGASGRAFEQGLRDFNGDTSKAGELASRTQLLENQRLVWDNLEKTIVGTSDAISGALTNGLVDIANGSKKIEDVGRDMLNNMARSFADAAQQQLTALLQRQLAGALGGLMGGGLPAGGGALGGLMGAAPSLIPGFAPSFAFGGFFANGGKTRPGEAYVVGDGGEPELFIPGFHGTVVPESKMSKIDTMREERDSRMPVFDFRYTVTEQAGQRYVTEEQYRKGQEATAQRARAMTYAGMRNSRDVRDYVGMD